jgi:tetratricopeptide (TPR) repeat protein
LYLGQALDEQGEFEQAIAHYEKAVEIRPNHVSAVNDLAWLLATCPEDGLRQGDRAVQLAERACEATGQRMPTVLDTLAAAYAEAGRFPEAVATATKALQLVQPNQQPLADGIRQRLERYKAGKPYRVQP